MMMTTVMGGGGPAWGRDDRQPRAGGVSVRDDGTFSMKSGTIRTNTAMYSFLRQRAISESALSSKARYA
jgi:hypothetical protein